MRLTDLCVLKTHRFFSLLIQPEAALQAPEWREGSFVPGAAGEGLFELTYSYTDVNGCSNEISAFLEVIENSVSVGADVTIIEGTSTALQAVGGVIFSWEPADGLSCTGCASPLASPAQTTTYWVTSWDAYGCMAIDTVRVEVVPFDDVTVFVPNTFTPNFDGINDYLFVYGSDIERINYLRIFDRWGNEVWFGENLPGAWRIPDGMVLPTALRSTVVPMPSSQRYSSLSGYQSGSVEM